MTAGDLSLLVSLYTARLIVWLTLRRREKERAREHAERRRKFGHAHGRWGVDESS